MSNFRTRPNNDYLYTANWNEVYVLTEHWKSDMAFVADELHFLDDLISKYFIWLTAEENVSKVQELVAQVHKLKERRNELEANINRHLMHIEELMENAFSHDEHQFRDEHVKLEEEMTRLTNDFKNLKKQVFEVTENVIESEKLEHLLNG